MLVARSQTKNGPETNTKWIKKEKRKKKKTEEKENES